jgi:hypothetical protein
VSLVERVIIRINPHMDATSYFSPYVAPCRITLAQRQSPAFSHRNVHVASSGPLTMDAIPNFSQSATVKPRITSDEQKHIGTVIKNAALLPDVMLDEDSQDSHPLYTDRDMEVHDLSSSNIDLREMDGPARLVTSTEFLRLQETVNELNEFLNRQSQILIALTEREAGSETTIKRSSNLPLQRSETHPSKMSTLPPAITAKFLEVGAICIPQFLQFPHLHTIDYLFSF